MTNFEVTAVAINKDTVECNSDFNGQIFNKILLANRNVEEGSYYKLTLTDCDLINMTMVANVKSMTKLNS